MYAFFAEFFVGLFDDGGEFFESAPAIAATGEVFLGASHAGEAGGGEGEDFEDEDGIGEVVGFGGVFDDAAHEDSQHVDFCVEALELGLGEVLQVGLAEFTRVEAVFEGVEVVALSTAQAAGARRGGRRVGGYLGHGWAGPFYGDVEH